MNIQTPIPGRPFIPSAPPPPELPNDISGIAHAIEAVLDNGPPARMGQPYYTWFRRLPGELLGAHEVLATELAATRRVSGSRSRTIDRLIAESATDNRKLVEYLEQVRVAEKKLSRRWHPVWVLMWGAALGVASCYLGYAAAIYIDVWMPVVRGLGL